MHLIFKEKWFSPGAVIHPKPAVLFQRKIFKWWFDHKGFIKWLFRKIPLIVLEEPKQIGSNWVYTVKIRSKKWRIK